MLRLTYSGNRIITQNRTQTAHDLLNKLLELSAADTPITVDSGQIRPQGDSLLISVSLSAEADLSVLQSVQDELADELIALGVEPDTETAKSNIRVSG
jgi:hypothetical protein